MKLDNWLFIDLLMGGCQSDEMLSISIAIIGFDN